MKKTLLLSMILLFIYVFALTSCNSNNKIQTQDSMPSSTTDTVTPTDVHVHVFEEWISVKNATCTSEGFQERYCSCGEKQVRTVAATGNHSFGEWKNIQDATCTKKGEEQRSCSCGKTEKRDIPALGHTEIIDLAVAATCTKDGKTEGKHCSICNTVIVAQQTIQASHTEIIDLAVAATCTKDGKTEGKHCLICGTVILAQTSISKTDHIYSNGKCTMCNALQPVQTQYYTFGDTVSFHYKYGPESGDFTVSLGSSYTKVIYTANKYNWVYGQQFVRIPIRITNDGDSTDSVTLGIIKLFDSNNNSNNPENGIYNNALISDTMFDDGHIFDDIRPHVTYSGAIYIPYTGAGTYALVINDAQNVDIIYECTVQ